MAEAEIGGFVFIVIGLVLLIYCVLSCVYESHKAKNFRSKCKYYHLSALNFGKFKRKYHPEQKFGNNDCIVYVSTIFSMRFEDDVFDIVCVKKKRDKYGDSESVYTQVGSYNNNEGQEELELYPDYEKYIPKEILDELISLTDDKKNE